MPINEGGPAVERTVPQIKLECDGSKDFRCNQAEVQTASHNNDLHVMCMNIDPTDPNKPDGTFLLSKTVFGEDGKGN